MPSTPPQKARPATDLAQALLQVKGAGALTTAAYRSALRAFLESGQAVTVEGFAQYIHQLRRTRSAATVNQALAAGRKAFLQAAERLGLPAREVSLIRGALAEIPYPTGLLRVPADYPWDAFFVPRHMCWGWGTWRDRWQRADWEIGDYPETSRDPSWRRSFGQVGVDLPGMLAQYKNGDIDSWAIRWTYTHFVNHAVCLVPVRSFVNNAGVDGTGTHMSTSKRYGHRRLNGQKALRLPPAVYVDPLIRADFMKAERRSLPSRAARKLVKILLSEVPSERRDHASLTSGDLAEVLSTKKTPPPRRDERTAP